METVVVIRSKPTLLARPRSAFAVSFAFLLLGLINKSQISIDLAVILGP